LCERKIQNVEDMEAAARQIYAMGPRYVLIKGGHLPGDRVVDLLFDGRSFIRRAADRIRGEFHGTGCTLSSAIAAGLARGLDVPEAVATAQDYIGLAIRSAPAPGGGRRPLNHFPDGFVPPEIRA
ncbi:MAG TPA: bifunctional hydroxymethylpyrimidine kinase/phosphomethylpyrimidine kinase, partial [Candidatus Baltobacteraceae bacterium]|nr:bifunctional hydroxymethylpyrimidine kinase/phosphomethylpyrimidine kinase [Candidatus Baltobacteraceae bacterium]